MTDDGLTVVKTQKKHDALTSVYLRATTRLLLNNNKKRNS